MSFVIGSKCVSICDTGCIAACPVDCIHGPIDPDGQGSEAESMRKDDKLDGLQLYINPSECIECGACLEHCPPRAIYEYEEDAIDDGEKMYVHKNYNFFEVEIPQQYR
jgi:NAD-dependent dihydropyrimidine dehydrogenase PreA subunit